MRDFGGVEALYYIVGPFSNSLSF